MLQCLISIARFYLLPFQTLRAALNAFNLEEMLLAALVCEQENQAEVTVSRYPGILVQ